MLSVSLVSQNALGAMVLAMRDLHASTTSLQKTSPAPVSLRNKLIEDTSATLQITPPAQAYQGSSNLLASFL
uniref:Uncharacterized protein n=1 Tax=Salvator merianae TaxID=96440 RepID=A0A8D0BQJ5_SALMN